MSSDMDSKNQGKTYDRNELSQKLLSSFNSVMERFEFLWESFGISEVRTAERANAVVGHLCSLLTELIKEENSLYESIKQKIMKYKEDITTLSSELEVKVEMPDENLPLLQKDENLKEQLEKLEKEKNARIKEYKQLMKKESKLCDRLDMPKTALKDFSKGLKLKIPTKQELFELQQNINMLSEEKERRYKKFCSVKAELTTIMEVTELSPETSFERQVVCYDDDTFVLSNENLQDMTHVLKKYKQRQMKLEKEKNALTEKLTALWDRLNIDKGERTEFLNRYSECRQSTIDAFKDEINRCEEVKRQNISEYVGKLRQELTELWKKCCMSEEEQKNFKAFDNTDYTEELLELFEKEVDRMNKYYEETKEIFEKIAKRNVLWDLMLKFERKAADPNRFTNRGGNLLQEERERKKLLKDLPRLEEEILKAIGEYEEKNDAIFLVCGINFSEYIENQWSQHMKEKENEKLERQRMRSMQNETGRPSKTPSKRALFSTPVSAPSKLSRTNMGMSAVRMPRRSSRKFCTNQATPSDFRKMQGTRINPKSPYINPNTRTPCSRVLMERNEVTPSMKNNGNDTTSYSQFATELDKNARERCRSSVLVHSRKVLGSKISYSGGALRKSMSSRSSSRKSSSYSLRSSSNKNSKSYRNTSRTPTKMTPARAKLGLPFLI